MFTDRTEAGRALVPMLLKYKNEEGVVLAVPKGGIPVGYEIARALKWPLEPVLTKKIGHPMQKEYAIGAMSTTGSIIMPHNDVPEEYIMAEQERIGKYLTQMKRKFMGDREPAALGQKTVVVVDDGVATGNTLLMTIDLIKKSYPARIILAVPVSTVSGYRMLSKNCDEMVTPVIEYGSFSGVGAYYENFNDVSEEEALSYLVNNRRELKPLSREPGKPAEAAG